MSSEEKIKGFHDQWCPENMEFTTPCTPENCAFWMQLLKLIDEEIHRFNTNQNDD